MARSRGFTLVELTTGVVVLGITLAMALPAMNTLVLDLRATNGFHALTASLMSARMAAVMRRTPVSVCPSADGQRCRSDLVWSQGWMVFLDPARSGQPEGPGAVLQQHPGLGRGLHVRSTAGRHRVRYQPTGLSGGNNLTLRICVGARARHVGDVVVNMGGRAKSRRQKRPGTPCPFVP